MLLCSLSFFTQLITAKRSAISFGALGDGWCCPALAPTPRKLKRRLLKPAWAAHSAATESTASCIDPPYSGWGWHSTAIVPLPCVFISSACSSPTSLSIKSCCVVTETSTGLVEATKHTTLLITDLIFLFATGEPASYWKVDRGIVRPFSLGTHSDRFIHMADA